MYTISMHFYAWIFIFICMQSFILTLRRSIGKSLECSFCYHLSWLGLAANLLIQWVSSGQLWGCTVISGIVKIWNLATFSITCIFEHVGRRRSLLAAWQSNVSLSQCMCESRSAACGCSWMMPSHSCSLRLTLFSCLWGALVAVWPRYGTI